MMAGVGTAAMIVQGGLIRPITTRFGERRTVLISLLCGSVGFFVYGTAFGKIGMVFGLGFIFGPALGGWLGAIDPRLPFWGAATLSLLNACYGFFVLPESLPPDKRTPLGWARANPVGSLVLLRSHHELFGRCILADLSPRSGVRSSNNKARMSIIQDRRVRLSPRLDPSLFF
jgi:MFS family permease